MRNKTKYTCPTLMRIGKYLYQWKLRKTHRVYWKHSTPEPDRPAVWYVVAQPHGRKGGFQVSVPFPRWMIRTEMWIRRTCLSIYVHFRHPLKKWEHYKWMYNVRKKRLISKGR